MKGFLSILLVLITVGLAACNTCPYGACTPYRNYVPVVTTYSNLPVEPPLEIYDDRPVRVYPIPDQGRCTYGTSVCGGPLEVGTY